MKFVVDDISSLVAILIDEGSEYTIEKQLYDPESEERKELNSTVEL